jgi:cell wall-associated NlpC family hydrolase
MITRRCILGPVIFVLVIGLVVINFGQSASAQTTEKKPSKHITAKKHTSSGKTAEKKQSHSKKKAKSIKKKQVKTAHASAAGHKHRNKTKLSKNSRKHAHHRGTLASRPFKDLEYRQLPVFPSPQPSDLWLAKDLPETYRELTCEGDEQQNELTFKILESAYSYLGAPYRYGGTTPSGFDCSGFIRYVFNQNGIKLGRSSREQALEGVSVPVSDLKPGDLIFFNMHRRNRYLIDHVGLYVGNGQFIHATSSRSHDIKVESLESWRYLPKIVEARRVLDSQQ